MTAVVADAAGGSLRERATSDGVRYLLATFTTLTGKPCSKLVPISAADELEAEGAGFAGYAAGAMGQEPTDPDIIAVPDVSSYTPLTFLKPGLGLVHCDPHVNGSPHPYAPRIILKNALAAAGAVSLKAGAEVEYFLVRRGPDGVLRPADDADDAAQPCYDARGVTRMYDHLTAVSDAMASLGWGPYASDHEDGNGQFEQNFAYDDALVTADRVVTLRYIIQMMAEQRGMIATFMPKPFTDRTGTGMHLHLSLWDGDRPLFPAARGEAEHSASGLGISAQASHFVAGLLDHAGALHSVLAPTVNSYKRSGARSTASGATWAPSTASYGGNDRTHLVRVPDHHRVELRAGDGAASSYLALAVALGAGMDGVARQLDPGAPGGAGAVGPTGHATEVPRTLAEAVTALEADDVVRGVLDSGGPAGQVSGYYAALKREEFYAWHSAVSAWEVERYLTAV